MTAALKNSAIALRRVAELLTEMAETAHHHAAEFSGTLEEKQAAMLKAAGAKARADEAANAADEAERSLATHEAKQHIVDNMAMILPAFGKPPVVEHPEIPATTDPTGRTSL
jgi:hypothetical protein